MTLTRVTSPRDQWEALAGSHQYAVEQTKVSLILRAAYEPGRFELLQAAIAELGLGARVRRSVSAEYEMSDWAKADLIVISPPPAETSELDIGSACETCGEFRITQDTAPELTEITWRNAVVTVNGRLIAVLPPVRDALKTSGVSGLSLRACDAEARAYWFLAVAALTAPSFRREETLDDLTLCSECLAVTSGMAFGPVRYPRAKWSGDDVVYSTFHQLPVVSRRVAELLKAMEPDTVWAEPVYLE